MPLPLTLPCVLNEVHLLGCTVQFGMLLLTSCTPKALDQYPAGSMIISSLEFSTVFSQNTMRDEGNGTGRLYQGASIMRVVGFGLEDEDSKMVHWKSLMRIVLFPVRTCLGTQCNQQKMIYTHTTSRTLMLHHKGWASHGKSQKTGSSLALQPTSVLTGTLKCTKFCWQWPRNKSTSRQ